MKTRRESAARTALNSDGKYEFKLTICDLQENFLSNT